MNVLKKLLFKSQYVSVTLWIVILIGMFSIIMPVVVNNIQSIKTHNYRGRDFIWTIHQYSIQNDNKGIVNMISEAGPLYDVIIADSANAFIHTFSEIEPESFLYCDDADVIKHSPNDTAIVCSISNNDTLQLLHYLVAIHPRNGRELQVQIDLIKCDDYKYYNNATTEYKVYNIHWLNK